MDRLAPSICINNVHDIAQRLENSGGHNVSAFEDSYSLYLKLVKTDSLLSSANEPIKAALTSLYDAFRIFGPDCVIASYNGGKDAVVIMHLLRAALAAYSVEHGKLWRPKLIYFVHDKEFPEVKELVYDTVKRYDLELVTYANGFVNGLTQSVENSNGKPLAFVLGTRKGDPNSADQEIFAPSSHWMPPFMRVNPILDWNYGQVWRFLVDNELPFCRLYNDGYTSLGKIDDTERNPALRTPTGRYLPASDLEDWNLERAGRTTVDVDVCNLARRAVERTRNTLKHAKTVSVILVDEPIKTNYHSVFGDGVHVRSISTVSSSQLQLEMKRQSELFDFVVIIKKDQIPPHVGLKVDTTGFGLNSPSFYPNVLEVPGIDSHDGVWALLQRMETRIQEMMVVNASVVKVSNQVVSVLQSRDAEFSCLLYSGFDFLNGERTVMVLQEGMSSSVIGLCEELGWHVERATGV